MPRSTFVYAIYIDAPQEAVFDALTDPAMTRDYWRHENASDWKVGSQWRHVPITGTEDHAANSSTSFCAYVLIMIPSR